MGTDSIEDYRKLISQFLNHDLEAPDFEAVFFQKFKNETRQLSDDLFRSLDKLFADLDMFCADDELRDGDELNEEQLRQCCERTLLELDMNNGS